jgi:ornithine cyclodeaminase/alanine dehydrogenase-like protein (mu-crystallin family)
MPLLLNEAEVTRLLTMPEAIDAVEAAFKAQASGDGTANQPRARFFLPKGVLHHMAAALPAKGVMGTKTYTSFAGGTRFYVQLFSSETGELLAFLEADKLGQVRTGAATGVAARHMARPDVRRASLLGTGWQAASQAEALLAARPDLREFQVFSRDDGRREAFCRKMTAKLGIHFLPMDSAEGAARGTEIVVTATTAREPILKGEWLSPGDFVAAVGANRITVREIDDEVVARAAVVAVDDLAQAQIEAAELIFAYERRSWNWSRARTLADVVSGVVPARTGPEDITLFKSLGVALEDVAVAALVYEKARAQNVGRDF